MTNNHNEQQTDFLKDMDFIRQSIMFKPIHIDYLRTIDPDNISKANRMVIDNYMRQTRITKIQQYGLVIMVFLILILGIYQILII